MRYLTLAGFVAILLLSGCGQGASPTITMPRKVTTTTPRVSAALSSPSGTAGVTVDVPVAPTAAAPNANTPVSSGGIPLPPPPASIAPTTNPSQDIVGLPLPPPLTSLPTTTISPKDTIPPEDPVVPDRVTGLSAQVVGVREIVLEWNPSEAEYLMCYNVYRSTRPDGTYSWQASPAEAYYRDTKLDQSAIYYYYVEAIDYADNKGEKSAVVSVPIIVTPVVLELFGQDG